MPETLYERLVGLLREHRQVNYGAGYACTNRTCGEFATGEAFESHLATLAVEQAASTVEASIDKYDENEGDQRIALRIMAQELRAGLSPRSGR